VVNLKILPSIERQRPSKVSLFNQPAKFWGVE